jgi:hypothetical protein
MRAGLLRTSLRFLTWVCVVVLAVLSLTPLKEIAAVRTDLPGQVEHIAYAGSTAIAMAGYGLNRSAVWIISYFCRQRPGMPPELLTRPEPGICGFRSVGARSPVRWDCRRPTLALALCATGSARRRLV